MKKFLSILFVSGIIFSCKQTSATSIVNAPVDSLIASWGNSWNHHDSAGGRNLFGDALLIDDDLIAHNPKEISAKWIHPQYKRGQQFKIRKVTGLVCKRSGRLHRNL
jgi:hypothetical protein